MVWSFSALMLSATTFHAQPGPYRVDTLAPNVFAVVRDGTGGGASDSNVMVIVNAEDVVVVDTNIFPSSARQVINEIKRLTTKPVRYVVNTHWHSDHHYGNQAYREAYPGVEFIQHPSTRDNILTRDMPDLEKNLTVEYPATVSRIRKALQTGKTSRGDSVTAAMREQFTGALADYEFFMTDMKGPRPVPGTMVVADSLVLYRGDRTIVIRHLGAGNTAGDLIVHLPKEQIIASGDLVVLPIPFAFESYPDEWPGTLRALVKLNAKVIMPGHGEIQRDNRYVNRLISLLESTRDQVKRGAAAGLSLDSTIKTVNVEEFRADFGGTGSDARRRFEGLFLRPFSETVYSKAKPAASDSAKSSPKR
jgi:glyoxylase-like metal-dependent hydrolase (beta-lactamase superfamily II)